MPETPQEEEAHLPEAASALPGERAIAPESQRVYVDAAVNFRAEGGRAATGFVKDLSLTGMFVATDTLYLSGTEIEFSIRVGEILLEGTGRVVWQRAAPSSRGLPIGIGVSFDRLDPESRASIRELVGGMEATGEPEKLEELREAVSAGLDANRDWRPASGRTAVSPTVYRAQRNRRDARNWGVPVASAIVIALLFFFGMGLHSRLPWESDAAPSPRERNEARRELAAETAGANQPPIAAEESATPVSEEPPREEARLASEANEAVSEAPPETAAAATEAAPREVAPEAPVQAAASESLDLQAAKDAVGAWASAWQEQNVSAYLQAYVANYAPPSSTNEAWRAQRRQRLTAPSVIEVEVEELEVEANEAQQRATATFIQRYRSDQYRDVVRKTLVLERQAGSWKIRSESSSPL
ncbi:MAG: PilZ domain-containing protein [Acidobacteriota bacterium]